MPGATEDRGDDHTPTEDLDDKKPDASKATVTDEDLKKVGVEDKADEGEGEGDEKDEKDEKGEKKPGKKDTRIPLARHEELLGKERERREALERELANTRQGQQVAVTNEKIAEAEDKLIKLEGDYTKLLADGEVEKASKLLGDIRKVERAINETKSTLMVQAAEARAYERVRYDTVVERLEEAYPKLNPDHADYDAALTTEVVELRDAYVSTGRYGRAEAIQKATKTLMGAATARQDTAVTADVRVDKAEVAKATAQERAAASRTKAADAAAKQPPSLTKVGLDSDKLGGVLDAKAVIKMSQDEFSKLDDKVLAKMRGDELV